MPPTRTLLGIFFGLLGAIFLVLAFRSSSRQNSIAARVHRRIGLIFAAVGIVLIFWGRLLP
jgi:hypothetical protein